MSILDIMNKRISIRKYTAQSVEKGKLDYILKAAERAPTAANRQAYKIYILQGENTRQLRNDTLYGAPLGLLVCSEKDNVWVRKYDGKNMVDIDASIVTDHMMLAATDCGLGSIWITYFDPERVKKELDLPDNLIPVNFLAVGYTASDETDEKHSHSRRPIEEKVVYV